MKVVNLTPHTITLLVKGTGINHGQEAEVVIASTGIARVESKDSTLNYMATDEPVQWPDGGLFDVTERTLGDIIGLPEPEESTVCVVSMPVAQRAAELGRQDVFGPDTGTSAVRDEKGLIKAVRGLVRYKA